MKTISVRDLQKGIRQCVQDAQRDRIVVTRRGKPAAVLIGVEGLDWETVTRKSDPKFWRLIQQRRKQPAVPLRDVRKRMGL